MAGEKQVEPGRYRDRWSGETYEVEEVVRGYVIGQRQNGRGEARVWLEGGPPAQGRMEPWVMPVPEFLECFERAG